MTDTNKTESHESQSEKEIRETHERMTEIEKECGGFGNIPASNDHEYWSLRRRLQKLLLSR